MPARQHAQSFVGARRTDHPAHGFSAATLRAMIGLLVLAAQPAASAAQSSSGPEARQPRWRVELGAAHATPLVEDGNGVTVRAAPGMVAGVERVVRVAPRSAAAIGLVADLSRLSLRSGGRRWSAGTATRVDLVARAERETWFATTASLGIAATRVIAADDVIPFRASDGSITSWSTHAAIARRIRPELPFDVALAADMLRLPGQPDEDLPMEAGFVARLRLMVRYAR